MDCNTCGHQIWEHLEGDAECRCVYANGKVCNCKAFKIKVDGI